MSRTLITVTLLLAAVSMWGQAAERYVVLDGASAQARVFNVSGNSEIAAIRTGPAPNSIAISPNGRLAFVANANVEYVSVIDLTIQAEIKRIRDTDPDQLALSADGTRLVVTDANEQEISIIDATTLSVIQDLDLNGRVGDDPNSEDLGFNNPVIFGNKVYLNTSADIAVIDLGTLAVTNLSGPDDALFFRGAENLAITPDGKVLAAIRAGGLVLIDTSTNSTILTVPLISPVSVAAGTNPSDPSKMVAYVVNSGAAGAVFSILDLTSGSPTFGMVIGEIPLPAGVPLSQRTMIAMDPAGTHAYVHVSSPHADPNLFVVDTAAVMTDPAAAIIHQAAVSLQARSMAIAPTLDQPPATAPVVAGVNRTKVRNNHATTIDLSGSGFAPGANVRIGTLDPIAAEFVSPGRLRVTLPENAPSQNASIIVTNPNSAQGVGLQQQSGMLLNALTIAGPENFKPDNQVGVVSLGDSTFSVIKEDNDNGVTTPIPTGGLRPLSLAISPDGARAYIGNLFPPASVDVFNFKTNSMEAHIILNGDPVSTTGQAKGIVFAPRLATGKLAAYVVASRIGNLDLYAIDADPASPTFNTIVDDIPTNIDTAFPTAGSLAMSPDGRFAFIDELDFTDVVANFVVLDLATHAVTKIPAAVLGINPFELTMEVTSDGKFILLEGFNNDDTILVFDVATNPTSPALFATIKGTPPAGQSRLILEFPRIVGTHLFTFDIDDNIVTVFNFNPAANDFSQVGSFIVPGPTALLASVADVTPDGKLIYMPIREEDSVAVMDVNKILQNDPSALVTKIGVGNTAGYVVVRP